MLEVAPAVAGAAILLATRKRFPLTRLAYVLILIHCVILMVGGHYTYAEVPAGEWFRDLFDPPRNNYDKLGHLAQGFIPAIVDSRGRHSAQRIQFSRVAEFLHRLFLPCVQRVL